MTQAGNVAAKQGSSFSSRAESLFTNLQVSLYRMSGGSIAAKRGAHLCRRPEMPRESGVRRTGVLGGQRR